MKNKRITSSYIFNSVYSALFLLCSVTFTYAQNYTVDIQWEKAIDFQDGDNIVKIPSVMNGSYERGLPHFSWQEKVKPAKYDLVAKQFQLAPITSDDHYVIQKYGAEIGYDPTYQLAISDDRSGSYIRLGIIPYVFRNNTYYRVTSFQVEATLKGFVSSSKQKDFAANSVLSSGTWYKISVSTDGIYKLDKSFFETIGVDVSTLNPQQVNVYGNASGRLPESNAAVFYDDLVKDAIVAVGENDGVFNDGDYFLFYGVGPNRLDYNSATGFEQNRHIYADASFYFIRIDDASGSSRISTLTDNLSSPTNTVNSYDYFALHEEEKYNLVGGGQRWYGELFDGYLSQDFSFAIPNLILTEPLSVKYALASNASSSGNNFRFYSNGSLLQTQAMSSASSDFARNSGVFTFTPSSSSFTLNLQFNRVNASVKGYLDFIEITSRRSLNYVGSFRFRDTRSVGAGNVTKFQIVASGTSLSVWDVTNPRIPKAIQLSFNGSVYEFTQATDTLREFILFNNSDFKTPSLVGRLTNQNLHGLPQVDYVIVTHPNFLSQAQRLGDLHTANGTSTHVVTTSDIYNEFSSGAQDATAIKRFMKMFYDRANGDPALQPKNLLLFGDATYDPKGRMPNNNYFVPTYEFVYSEDHLNAMVTDDYFGILGNNGSIASSDLMQIGVGRLLISNNEQAVEQVNKIEHYMKNGSQMYTGGANACCSGEDGSTFGNYRMNYTLITDDDDDNEQGYFIKNDAEPAYKALKLEHPQMNATKIYCDANVQTSGAGGERYPEVFNKITDKVETGSLIVNYIGHGGEVGAAKERIITIPQIQSWANINKLGLFVTATCEFTKFDDPARVSAGEWISLNPVGGSIALMTTTRSVYFNVNTNTVKKLYENVFDRSTDGEPLTLGEIMRLTKNGSGSNDNKRSFNLIGDPNLKIAIPRYRIVTDSINHFDPDLVVDTVKALSKMHVVGHLEDYSGNVLTAFNGVLSPTIYDKVKISKTLQNEPNAPLINFEEQESALYKGKFSVKNGYFRFEFIVPKDINYNYGRGKISYYANSNLTDAGGVDTAFIVGGLNTSAPIDNDGPDIRLFLNDKNFVNGGITSTSPLLIIETFDENGINTVGNGVGHDLTLVIDGNTANPIVLNQYYSADLDQYQSGSIQYTMRNLSAGDHTIDVKIWDVNNNSNTARLDFTVRDQTELAIDHVLNYPNPFTTKTTFFFEHNQSCSSLNAQVQIFSVSGRLVKTINKEVPTAGFRIEGIDWDGTDDFGDQLAKGVYVYRVSVELPEGGKAEKMEKLVLLR